MSEETPRRARVLDPIERASEAIFGVLMAVSITGSISVATAGSEETRTMVFAALGCNVAWGLTDAVMYLVSAATEQNRRIMLLQRLREITDSRAAHDLVAAAMPSRFAGGASAETLEAIRKHLVAIPVPRVALGPSDFAGALGVFFIVVLATFPAVIPFLFVRDAALAMRMSNTLAVVTLYAYGHLLGWHAGGRPWRYGLSVAALGVGLVAVIMALGG